LSCVFFLLSSQGEQRLKQQQQQKRKLSSVDPPSPKMTSTPSDGSEQGFLVLYFLLAALQTSTHYASRIYESKPWYVANLAALALSTLLLLVGGCRLPHNVFLLLLTERAVSLCLFLLYGVYERNDDFKKFALVRVPLAGLVAAVGVVVAFRVQNAERRLYTPLADAEPWGDLYLEAVVAAIALKVVVDLIEFYTPTSDGEGSAFGSHEFNLFLKIALLLVATVLAEPTDAAQVWVRLGALVVVVVVLFIFEVTKTKSDFPVYSVGAWIFAVAALVCFALAQGTTIRGVRLVVVVGIGASLVTQLVLLVILKLMSCCEKDSGKDSGKPWYSWSSRILEALNASIALVALVDSVGGFFQDWPVDVFFFVLASLASLVLFNFAACPCTAQPRNDSSKGPPAIGNLSLFFQLVTAGILFHLDHTDGTTKLI
jgi:hypothetical protein